MPSQELESINGSSPQKSELELAEQALEPQERLFCYEWIVDFDHKRAAIAVGRSPAAGIKLLRNPKISKLINILSAELSADSLISRDMVQYELLHEYLPRARGDKEICGVDRDGVAWEGKVTNMAAYGKALDIMAKHSNFTQPEVVAGGLTININHQAMGMTIEGEYSEQRDSGEEDSEEGSAS